MTATSPNPQVFNKYNGLGHRQVGATRFTELMALKQQHLDEARECAALTKPLVVPPSGHVSGAPLPRPESSHGARLVDNLVSQLLLILFPPGIPFVRLDLEALDLKDFARTQELPDGRNLYDALRETFVGLEVSMATRFDTSGLREKVYLILQQLVVAGDSCYIVPEDSPLDIDIVPFEDWVCVRSPSGELLEVITRRYIPDVETEDGPSEGDNGYSTVFTRHYQRQPRRWVTEEFLENSVEPVHSYETKGLMPDGVYIPYWSLASGEDYGRSIVDENLGDLRTYESGTKIVKESASALAKVIFTTRPNGTIRPHRLAEAENCEIIEGDPSDVGVVQAQKLHDMSGFISFLNNLKMELDIVFMMPTALRRHAERVTAEEIREIASQFERTRGATYGLLSRHIQGPLATILLEDVYKDVDAVGTMSVSDLVPIVNTGLQGLGRTLELEGYLMLLNDLRTYKPEALGLIKDTHLVHKLAGLRGVQAGTLLKTLEELQAESQEAMANQMAVDNSKTIMEKSLL